MKTIAVIPTYNNAETIGSVIRGAGRQVDKVIVVDDGSTDDTPGILRRLAKRGHCTVLTHQKNRGKGEALKTAISHLKSAGKKAQLGAVVFLDADGEHQPEEIPRFISSLETADIVLGVRTSYRSKTRHLLNRWMALWFRILSSRIIDPSCGFRAVRWPLLERLELRSSDFSIDAEIVLEAVKAGASITSVRITPGMRAESTVGRADYLRMNDFFDQWVLRNAKRLRISPTKKMFLLCGASVGRLAGGLLLVLAREREFPSQKI